MNGSLRCGRRSARSKPHEHGAAGRAHEDADVTRAAFLAAVLALLLPVAQAAAIRLIERNGESITGRDIVSLRVTQNGVVVIVPDQIFAGGFER